MPDLSQPANAEMGISHQLVSQPRFPLHGATYDMCTGVEAAGGAPVRRTGVKSVTTLYSGCLNSVWLKVCVEIEPSTKV